jgi:hypothetical protein
MKRHTPEPPPVHDTDRLSGIPRHRHDPEERPTREDRAPQGSQLFKLPDLPRFLRAKRDR